MDDPTAIPDDELPTDVKNGVLDGDGVPEAPDDPDADNGTEVHEEDQP